MSDFSRYGRDVTSVFGLLGMNEVDLTAALGWVMAQSPAFLDSFLRLLDVHSDVHQVTVALEVADADGRTDIELVGPRLKVVIEAKQGWLVPGEHQLSKYVDRFNAEDQALLLSLSDSSDRWARDQLPASIRGVPVRHLPWDGIRSIVRQTMRNVRGRERVWLEELERYMGAATSRRPVDDQWVYCVVLSDAKLGGSSFKDYVTRQRVYFHPYGGRNGWPKRPPNLLCFRWGGVIRQVNRVASVEVVACLQDRFSSVGLDEADGPHIVYSLGPDIPIPHISTQRTYATGRVWCLLDQLLTQPTLADAVRSSDALTRTS